MASLPALTASIKDGSLAHVTDEALAARCSQALKSDKRTLVVLISVSLVLMAVAFGFVRTPDTLKYAAILLALMTGYLVKRLLARSDFLFALKAERPVVHGIIAAGARSE